MPTPDPLVLARIQMIAETTDGPSLVQAYMDLLTFGPPAFATLLAVIEGDVVLTSTSTHSTDAREAVLGALAWLGHRYPDEMFAALGEPGDVHWTIACSIERIDDPRTTEILLDVAGRDSEKSTEILLPALVRRRDDRVLPLLERALFSTNRRLRVRAAEGFYAMGDSRSREALRAALGHEDDGEVRAILADAVARVDDPTDRRELRWFWVIVRPRFSEMGVAAFDEDDVHAVLGLVRYAGREVPPVRSITALDTPGASPVGSKPPVGLPAWRGMWAPRDITVWRAGG